MPVRVVLDHPRRYLGHRMWRPIATFVGMLLLLVGIAASVVAVPATVLAGAWLLGEDVNIEIGPAWTLSPNQILLTWVIVTPLAVVGVKRGLQFVRSGRTLVLFLRRFGYDDVTNAVTFAVTRTIGSTWRIVTLDDAEIAPLGVTTGTRWFYRVTQMMTTAVGWLVEALLKVFPAVQTGLWVVVGLDLVLARIWEHPTNGKAWIAVLDPYVRIIATTFDGHLPIGAVGLSLPGAFALLAVILAGIVIGLGKALLAAPAAWGIFAALLFVLQFPAKAAQEGEQSKTREINTQDQISTAAQVVAERSRKFFGPRLVVLRVASSVWRQTVSRFAAVSSVALIDVSEPTDNLLWEIEELTASSRTKCVFICRHDRALELSNFPAASSASPGTSSSSGNPARPFDAEVVRLLETEQLLAYATDRPGRRRFARALRCTLISMSSRPRLSSPSTA